MLFKGHFFLYSEREFMIIGGPTSNDARVRKVAGKKIKIKILKLLFQI